EIENHVCVGTCFSYSVPQTDPETPGDELLDYCDSCQASNSHWTTLMLDCEEYGQPYQVPKTIQMITNCSCSPCHPSRAQPTITNEVTLHNNDHHVSELIYKMLPDTHKFKDGAAALSSSSSSSLGRDRELKYTEVSLGDLKKEFNLDAHQETLLQGKVLFKDSASFIDNDEEEDPRHLNY
ncbi:Borealin, partial [Halocaridina rubra]